MPRPNKFELSVVGVERLPRPDPPAELTPTETDEWRAIVVAMPAAHFPGGPHPLLVGYCRSIVASRELAAVIERVKGTEPFDVNRWQSLLRSQAQLNQVLSMLATKMRLAQQTVTDRRTRKPDMIDRPWD